MVSAVLALEGAAAYPAAEDEEPPQMVVFLFGDGTGFGSGEAA